MFACVPLGLIGGMVALQLRGLPFSIPAAVGLHRALRASRCSTASCMASELQRRLDDWASTANPLVESAAAVLRPVITTALVAAIGFLPDGAIDARRRRGAAAAGHGRHRRHPVSTLLSLFVLPTLLKLLVKRRRRLTFLLSWR